MIHTQAFYLSQTLHRLSQGGAFFGSAEMQIAVKTASPWHKFIIDPFDLGDKAAPADFADDLLKHGLFKLPFDNLIIWAGPIPPSQMKGNNEERIDNKGNKINDQPAADLVIVSQRDGCLIGRWIEVVELPKAISLNGGSAVFTFPLSMSRSDWIAADGFYELTDFEKKDSFISDDGRLMLANTVGGLPFAAYDYLKIEKERFIAPIFELVGMLNADGIVSEDHKAPKFINQKRERQGKYPLLSYHLLTIDKSKLKMPGVVSSGGTHASPRLHWRRGHIRKLPNGKLVTVRPCLVGSVNNGGLMKDYSIH